MSAVAAGGAAGRAILLLCDTDSQVFGTAGLARAAAAAGHPVTYGLFGERLPAAARAIAAEHAVLDLAWPDLLDDAALGAYGAVGFFSHGSRIEAFRRRFAAAFPGPADRRPLLFTGFNGLILEKFEEGAAWRAGYDLLLVPGPRDVEAFRAAFAGTAVADQPLLAAGLGFAAALAERPARPPGDARRLVFAEQSVIPAEWRDRLRLVAELRRLAAASPHWEVLIKVRVTGSERTFHRVRGRVEDLLAVLGRKPANLVVTSEPLAALLARADVLATVSSTAVFEALRSGVPAAVVADFGLSSALGLPVFAGSGLAVNLGDCASLDDLAPGRPDPAWLARVGFEADPASLVPALAAIRDAGGPLPPPFYGPDGVMPLPAAFRSGPGVLSPAALALGLVRLAGRRAARLLTGRSG